MLSPITTHAQARMQQRGIRAATVELLLEYGREAHDHRGGRIVRFDKRSRRRIQREFGSERFRQVEPYLDAYAVLAEDDVIVTVGHRLARLPRSA